MARAPRSQPDHRQFQGCHIGPGRRRHRAHARQNAHQGRPSRVADDVYLVVSDARPSVGLPVDAYASNAR